MKNGTSQAILVTDLFRGDGPHHRIADAYVAMRCSRCATPVSDDAHLSTGGFLCPRCAGLVV